MKLYAMHWKGEENFLATGPTSWWTGEGGTLGNLEMAGIFTRQELEEHLADSSAARDWGVVVEIEVEP